jgi:outer membrane biogenesis lipoprotein LolB
MKIVLFAVLLLAGCASMQNTPAQDATWEKLNRCPKPGDVRVDADGRWQARGDTSMIQALVQCMNEQDPNKKSRQF